MQAHAHFERRDPMKAIVRSSSIVLRPDLGDALAELAHLVSRAIKRRDVATLRGALADLERVARVLRHKLGRNADIDAVLTSHNEPAGRRDPSGSRLADMARTKTCAHPPASELVTLACDDCGAFILNGFVIDAGRRPKRKRP